MAEQAAVVKVPLSFEPLEGSIKNLSKIYKDLGNNPEISRGIKAQLDLGYKAALDFESKIAKIKPGDLVDPKFLEKLKKDAYDARIELEAIAVKVGQAFRDHPFAKELGDELVLNKKKAEDLRKELSAAKADVDVKSTISKKDERRPALEAGLPKLNKNLTDLDKIKEAYDKIHKATGEDLRITKLSIDALEKRATHDEQLKVAEENLAKARAVNNQKDIKDAEDRIALLGVQDKFTEKESIRLDELRVQKAELEEKQRLEIEQGKVITAAIKDRDAALKKQTQIEADIETNKQRRIELENKIASATAAGKKAVEEANRATDLYARAQKALAQDVAIAITQQKELKEAVDKTTAGINNSINRFIGLRAMFNFLRRGIRDALRVIKELDKAFTEMAMVTTYTTKQVWQMKSAFAAIAQQTGLTLVEVTQTAVEFFRQGRSYTEVLKLTEAAGIAAKVAGISATDSVNYLTSAVNGYKLSADQAMMVSDKFAALAASSATDYKELAIALSKVAAQAYSAGVNMDNMMGFIAKALEVTREAPENIGTAFKTIFARMSELKDYGKIVEDSMDVGRVDKALQTIGVSLLDETKEIRNLDEVLIDVGYRWKELDKNQKAYIATALAGTRQQTRLLAVFEDFDRTMELAEISSNSLGASYAQQAKYYDSIAYAQNNLTVAWQDFITNVVSSEIFIQWYTTLSELVYAIDSASTAWNGLGGVLLAVGTIIVGFLMKASLQATLATMGRVSAIKEEINVETKQIAEINNKIAAIDQEIAVNNKADAAALEHLATQNAILQNERDLAQTKLNNIIILDTMSIKEKENLEQQRQEQQAIIDRTNAQIANNNATIDAINLKNNNTGLIVQKQELVTQKAGVVVQKTKNEETLKGIVLGQFDLKTIGKRIVAQATLMATAMIYAAVLAAIVFSFKAMMEWINRDAIALKKLKENQDKWTASAYNTKQVINDIKKLREEYAALDKLVVTSTASQNQMLSITQKIKDLVGEDSIYYNVVINYDNTINQNALDAFIQEQNDKLNSAWQDIYNSLLQQFGGLEEVIASADATPVMKENAKVILAFQEAQKDGIVDTMAEFFKQSSAVRKEYQEIANILINMESQTKLFGANVDFSKSFGEQTKDFQNALIKLTGTTRGLTNSIMFDEMKEYYSKGREEYIKSNTYWFDIGKKEAIKFADEIDKLNLTSEILEQDMAEHIKTLVKSFNGLNLSNKDTIANLYTGIQSLGLLTDATKEEIDLLRKGNPLINTFFNVKEKVESLGLTFENIVPKMQISAKQFEDLNNIVKDLDLGKETQDAFLKEVLQSNPAQAFANLQAAAQEANIPLIEMLRIAEKLNVAFDKFSIQDLSYELDNVQSAFENLNNLQDMLSGKKPYDIAEVQNYLNLYKDLGLEIRENFTLTEEGIADVMKATKEQFLYNIETKVKTLAATLANIRMEKEAVVGLLTDTAKMNSLLATLNANNAELNYANAMYWYYKELNDKTGLYSAQLAYFADLSNNANQNSADALTNILTQQQTILEGKEKSTLDQITNLRMAVATLNNVGGEEKIYESKMSRIRLLKDGIDDLSQSLSLLQAEEENLSGSDLVENLAKQQENIQASNDLMTEQNDAYRDAQQYLWDNNKLLRDNTEIIDGQLYVKESYLNLNGTEMKSIDELVSTWNGYSESINSNSAAIQKNIKQIEEFNKKRLKNIDDTKKLIIDAIKSEYETRSETAKKAYEEEKKWLEKRKALYEEAFSIEDFDKTLSELEQRRLENIKRIALMEGSSNTIRYQELMSEKADIDKEYSDLMEQNSRDALLKSLEDQQNSLDAEADATTKYYEDKINNITELEARAVAIINSGVDQTLDYLREHSPEFKNATFEAKELMLGEWRALVSETTTYFNDINANTPDLSTFVTHVTDSARVLGDMAIKAAEASNTSTTLTKEISDLLSLIDSVLNGTYKPTSPSPTSTNGYYTDSKGKVYNGSVAGEAIINQYGVVTKAGKYNGKQYSVGALVVDPSTMPKPPTTTTVKSPEQIRTEWNNLVGKYKSGNQGITQKDLNKFATDHPEVKDKDKAGTDWFGQVQAKTYKTGGLAYTTGPAWLDGTPNKPERVLSPVQTTLFEEMVNSLEAKARALNSTDPKLATSMDSSISIGQITIQTPQLNNTQDFTAAGTELAKAFRQAIAQRGVNINKKI